MAKRKSAKDAIGDPRVAAPHHKWPDRPREHGGPSGEAGTATASNGRIPDEAFGEEEVITSSVTDPRIISFKIRSRSPLLMNNPNEQIGMDDNTGLSVGKKKYNDDDEAKIRLYQDEGGAFYFPAVAFKKSLIKAGSGKKFGKNFATALIRGNVFCAEQEFMLTSHDGKPMKDYAIDKRPVVVGKARVKRCRPRFEKWGGTLALEIDVAQMHPKHVAELLSIAGRTIGVGDYRPEKDGDFGRFDVLSFSE